MSDGPDVLAHTAVAVLPSIVHANPIEAQPREGG